MHTPAEEVPKIAALKPSLAIALVSLLLASALLPLPALAQGDAGQGGRYIIVLSDDVDAALVAPELARAHGGRVTHVYTHAVKGFAANIPPARLNALSRDPRVKFIEPDIRISAADQTLPTGIDRMDAELNLTADIDGIDERVDIDIAILDTGIDTDHPDLNVVGGVRFYTSGSTTYQDDHYDDDHGHGTHVAGITAAIDNDIGVVGVAPGARLWSVRILGSDGEGTSSDLIAGIDWITERAGTIEIANLSLTGQGNLASVRQAIQSSVAAGVIYLAAAGNEHRDIYGPDGVYGTSDDYMPACYPEVAAISAMADSDGQPGGTGASTSYGPDDSFASLSNYSASVVATNPVTSPGAAIDLLMPGISIYSTERNGTYSIRSGTSMASAHASGLAALYIAAEGTRDFNGDGAVDEEDVYAIRQRMIDNGVAQDGPLGLSTLNDPDANRENIGLAEPTLPDEAISTPSVPTGASSGLAGQVLTYSTGGAESNLGHSIQHRFDWGDGSYSSWSSTPDASHYWSGEGTFDVRAQARCSVHTGVVSDWSGNKSVEITLLLSDSPPLAPSGLTATAISTTRIDLAWQDNSDNEIGFVIERKYRDSGYFHEIDRVGTNVMTYGDINVEVNRTYEYRVKAWNYVDGDLGPVIAYSAPSNEASASTSSGGGCFIATAAYGSYLDRHVDSLRSFRDSRLATSPLGRGLVSTYYRFSPPIASFIDEHASLKAVVRAGLLPALGLSAATVTTPAGFKIAVAAPVVLSLLAAMLWLRRRLTCAS